jgi:hypothetical protein
MKVKSIYCECGLKRDFTAEDLAERWEVPANDEVWREYVFWRDYLEKKKSGQARPAGFPQARLERWREVTGD